MKRRLIFLTICVLVALCFIAPETYRQYRVEQPVLEFIARDAPELGLNWQQGQEMMLGEAVTQLALKMGIPAEKAPYTVAFRGQRLLEMEPAYFHATDCELKLEPGDMEQIFVYSFNPRYAQGVFKQPSAP